MKCIYLDLWLVFLETFNFLNFVIQTIYPTQKATTTDQESVEKLWRLANINFDDATKKNLESKISVE